MKTKFYFSTIVLLLLSFLYSPDTMAQVTGTIFRDINNDGVRQSTNPTEPGEYGIVVKAYDATNSLIASTTSNAAGVYSFSAAQIPAGMSVRLEFTINAGDQASRRISAGKSNIQFVTAGPTAVNRDFAVADKKWYSDNSNPYVAATAYTNGNALSSGSNSAGDNDNLYIFPYDLSSDGGSTRRAKNKYLGAVFGLAWQRESRTLLMAAFLKRHASFGPNGIGAIYQTQISKTGVPSTPTLLVDVSTIGINVGTNPRSTTLPNDSRTPNTDMGVFAQVGKRGIGGIDLSTDGRDLYIVNMYEKKLQRINVGNPLKSSFTSADVTGSWVIPDPGFAGTEWLPMAVSHHNGKFYVGGVTSKQTTTAHNMADTANLRGVVYEFDPASGNFTNVLTFALSYRRGFINADYRYEFRNNYWCAWQNNGDVSLGGPLRTGLIGSTTGNNATAIYYAQPMLSDIEFDIDGSMVIGVRDRFGDQGGYANYFESGNGAGETYRVLCTGEILRAGKTGANWVLENNGSITHNGVTTTTPGLCSSAPAQTGSFTGQTGTPWGGSFGPGGGYFYYNQNFDLVGVPSPFNTPNQTWAFHYTKSNGGLALYPGYNEVTMSAIDPVNKAYTNGVIRNYNAGAKAGNMSGRMELFGSNGNDPTNFGKAAALGDFELLLDAEAMEIGNRVWYDANGNGIQDATETGLANVVVVLRSPGADNTYNTGDDQTWSVTTDAEGHYYFDATIVNDNRRPAAWIGVSATNSGILPGFEYKLEIDATQTSLAGMSLSGQHTTNNYVDSDGQLNGTKAEFVINPGGSTAANSEFSNDYNIDFGFWTYVLPVKQLDLSANLFDNTASVNWITKGEFNVSRYYVERSTDGTHFNERGWVDSKGDGDFSYLFGDNLHNINAPAAYYRLRIVDKNGKEGYSATVRVNLDHSVKFSFAPNPVRDVLYVQAFSNNVAPAEVRISNSAGQIVYMKTLTLQTGMNSFSVHEMAKMSRGMYIIEMTINDDKIRQKLIKE